MYKHKHSFFSQKGLLRSLGVGFLAASMGASALGATSHHGSPGEHQPHTRREEEFAEQREDLQAVHKTKEGRRTLTIGGSQWYLEPAPRVS